jgi:hypothetical protein
MGMVNEKELDRHSIDDLVEAYELLCLSKPKTQELMGKVNAGKLAIYGALMRKDAADLVDHIVCR